MYLVMCRCKDMAMGQTLLMHGGLLCIAVRLSVCDYTKNNNSLKRIHIFRTIWVRVTKLRFDLEFKGHMGQGQRSRGSRSNKGSKQRQMGSRQCQVASFINKI